MSDISTGDFPESRSRQETYLQTIIKKQTGADISAGDFPEPRSRQEEYLQTIITNIGSSGGSGTNGVTFTPSVSAAGVISWTNDGGLENPASVNIKGPAGATGDKGDKGDKGDTGATGPAGAAGAKGEKGDTGATGPAGAKGEKGDTGAKGDKGDTGASVSAISLTQDSTGVITGGTATLSDGTTVDITITTETTE